MPRQDDPNLTGDLLVYRRIPPDADHAEWETDHPSFTKGNFKDKNDELSVHLASETTQEAVLHGWNGFGLVQMTVQQIRQAYAEGGIPAIVICRDDEDPANGHVLVCARPTGSIKKKLRDAARW